MSKIILHLCADIGSDSRYYDLDPTYEVIKVGEDVGVENYNPPANVHGIIANPVCTEFSTARSDGKARNNPEGMFLVDHCLRIIKLAAPQWWVLENPARGTLKDHLGKPEHVYQPWHYGSPWTKSTALWGNFVMPDKLFTDYSKVVENPNLYKRPTRPKVSLAFLHKSAIEFMPEYEWCKHRIETDRDLRSLCSDGFAREFYRSNP